MKGGCVVCIISICVCVVCQYFGQVGHFLRLGRAAISTVHTLLARGTHTPKPFSLTALVDDESIVEAKGQASVVLSFLSCTDNGLGPLPRINIVAIELENATRDHQMYLALVVPQLVFFV